MKDKIKRWVHSIYHQLVEINDTPHNKAAGLALGVFLGIFPGVGPLAALACSFVFRVNRAAALLGSIITNTWFTVITLALATKIGAAVIGLDQTEVKNNWERFIKDFDWRNILTPETWQVVYPVLVGFVLISFTFAVIVYCVSYFLLLKREQSKSAR